MTPATNIIPEDIGKTIKALIGGRYLPGEVVGYHDKRGKYVVYVVDSGEYRGASLKYAEEEQTYKWSLK